MIQIAQRLSQEKFKSKMILQVHDELLFEAPPNELKVLSILVKDSMENAHALSVPVKVDLKAGPNWRDMNEIKN
jgi:DNA polymerase-1